MSLDLYQYTGWTLLFLRLVVASIFFDSGRRHVSDTAARAKSIGMSESFTRFLGTVQILGSLGLAFGILTQLAALGLIVIMFGAIQKKALVWKTGFWGASGIGWHYEVMIIAMCLVIATTDGGNLVIWR
jgi:putative oxidoreductase